MKQGKINKAYPAIVRLCEFRLPIKKARAIYRMANGMKEHFDFALSEEKKALLDCNGTLNQDGTITFQDKGNFDMFQNRIDELNQSDIEWDYDSVILRDSDIGDQTISVSDIRDLEDFVVFE